MPITITRLTGEGVPPALLFTPPGTSGPLPLVLLGHGAHLSKDDPVMQILAKTICRGVPAAVALMDCPGHGERRASGISDEAFDADVRARMSDDKNVAQVRDDWIAVERAARAADAHVTGPTGYAGFSMGSVFGFAIVADLPSVTSAVFALGGLTRVEVRDALILDGARRLGARDILMLNMTRDEHFPIDAALSLFESIPGPKRMAVWAGTHVDLPAEAMDLAVAHFRRTLAVGP
jgi:dienelactone hydrolase